MVVAAASGVTLPASASASASASAVGLLTNLAHLDFLGATVSPPAAAGHSTYGSGPVGVLWTYADHRDDGSYARVGGGAYDPATDTYGQGAFNADDLARAAVVYLRHYKLRHDSHSLAAARGLLRGLTFLQTASGPRAGNVVLWMQPDGTLNPSADPVELPDPSDSGPSYWLARTVWALGEGYAVFRTVDPGFAAFLRSRLELAIAALERQVLVRYGQWNVVDGRRVPAWLIVAGADATSEAVLGLSAYVRAGGSARARKALARFASAVAAMGAGDTRSWPFRALLPWGESISDWHAWGAQMPSALAAAAKALGDHSLLGPAIGDAAGFTPLLLTAGGPDNGWLPAPIDRTQIAYGVDARVQGLLSVARAADRPGLRQVAAFAAAWYFGANRAGEPTYDPATGRTFDGVSGDGVINRNSGAESTIHGLLSMLALDSHAEVARMAQAFAGGGRTLSGLAVVEAEGAALAGGATVVTPPSAWTGESQWSNGSYVALPPGATATWIVDAAQQPRLVLPIVNLLPGSGRSVWKAGSAALDAAAPGAATAGSVALGSVDHGKVGPQGISAAPGALLPITLKGVLPAGATSFTSIASGPSVQIDAVLLLPLISSLRLGRGLLLTSVDAHTRSVSLPMAATSYSYDSTGRLRSRQSTARAVVLPGGFTVVC
ncbi:hypothetical protein F1D05_27725 [Kribbella qitaiheensis]|uniref:Uncharacterized protein n=1 Tax=Kribbella qitaiheensis TaxID=1544730 RepID=A0A7G6XAC7_9ACTN|nr:hypothetical protein F1D05_27725 [Kribbella qitaiheensis]